MLKIILVMIAEGALREVVLDTLSGVSGEIRFYQPNLRYYHGRQFANSVGGSSGHYHAKRNVNPRHRIRGRTRN